MPDQWMPIDALLSGYADDVEDEGATLAAARFERANRIAEEVLGTLDARSTIARPDSLPDLEEFDDIGEGDVDEL